MDENLSFFKKMLVKDLLEKKMKMVDDYLGHLDTHKDKNMPELPFDEFVKMTETGKAYLEAQKRWNDFQENIQSIFFLN